MEYNFANDLRSIREILSLTQDELAKEIGIEQITVSRSELGLTSPSADVLEKVYAYAFYKGININKLKEMLWKEETNGTLLFHGSKREIEGSIDIKKGRSNNDFGQGFYLGESYEQAISYVSNYDSSSVYYVSFDDVDLKCKKYGVDQEWMFTIAYYRGNLEEYKGNPFLEEIVEKSKNVDYIIAPIADNRMFHIINLFTSGELTNEQCEHCLAATNLGMQYVLKTDKAVSKVKIVERAYISNNERDYYKNIRLKDSMLGDNKVKLARIQYRGKGKYIDEILR